MSNMKVKIKFPQIVFETREVEVTEEQHEELIHHSCDEDRVKFIWENMTDQEQQWVHGKKDVESAVDVGYCGIESVENKSENTTA